MNLDQLRAFHQVARTGSFTKAARALFLTQPAVSQQVRALETHFGITLFNRSGRKVSLTLQGEILLAHTGQLFRHYHEIEELFVDLQNLKTGKITIGATAVMGTYFLPRMIGRYNEHYPGIDIDVRMGNSHTVLNMLLEDEVDIGFAGRIKANKRLTSILIHREKLLVVSAPKNLRGLNKFVSAADLRKLPFVWREKGTQTRALVRRGFKKIVGSNFPKKSIELENLEAAKRTVMEGYGITVVPEVSVRREIHHGLLKVVNVKRFDLSFNYHLFFLTGRSISRAATAFLKMLSDFKMLNRSESLTTRLPAA